MPLKSFITAEHQTALWEYLNSRIGLPWSTDFIALGRIVDGQLVGVVGYNNFTGTACNMHVAGEGPRWANRRFVREIFRYPFVRLGLTMVLGIVPSGNIRALRIDRKLGFTELLYIPGAHPDGGIHVLQLKRENCRCLGESYGKEISP